MSEIVFEISIGSEIEPLSFVDLSLVNAVVSNQISERKCDGFYWWIDATQNDAQLIRSSSLQANEPKFVGNLAIDLLDPDALSLAVIDDLGAVDEHVLVDGEHNVPNGVDLSDRRRRWQAVDDVNTTGELDVCGRVEVAEHAVSVASDLHWAQINCILVVSYPFDVIYSVDVDVFHFHVFDHFAQTMWIYYLSLETSIREVFGSVK